MLFFTKFWIKSLITSNSNNARISTRISARISVHEQRITLHKCMFMHLQAVDKIDDYSTARVSGMIPKHFLTSNFALLRGMLG